MLKSIMHSARIAKRRWDTEAIGVHRVESGLGSLVMVTKIEYPVFVYGTLRKGGTSNHIMNGARYDSRTRTSVGYRLAKLDDLPGMIYTGETAQVVGDLYYLTPVQMRRLDAFEDKRYTREKIPLETGRWAHAYLLQSSNGNVNSSDWG
jgi:gamma-glutamylcyclotransferase (GGCT)/AIG2-like uncharacterized protein YtfP